MVTNVVAHTSVHMATLQGVTRPLSYFVCAHARAHTRARVRTHTCAFTHMPARACTRTHTRACAHTHTHTHTITKMCLQHLEHLVMLLYKFCIY